MDRPRRSQRVVPSDHHNTPVDSPRPLHQALPSGGDAGTAATPSLAPASLPAKTHYKYRPYPTLGAIHGGTYAFADAAAHQPSWPLGRDATPLKPQMPIAHGQALHTTFPSRMRMGVSNLMQPLATTGDPHQGDPFGLGGGGGGGGGGSGGRNAPVDYGGAVGSRRSGRSNANQRRYVEQLSDDDDDEDDDDDDDDDDDGNGNQATGPPGTPSNSAALAGSSARGTPSRNAAAAAAAAGGPPTTPPEQPDVPGQRLGQPLPANKVTVKRANRTPHVYYSDADVARAADYREMLVPIHLELETETHRIKDSFLWNINERLLSPTQFARVFLQDLDVPYEPHGPLLESSIHQQIQEWTTLAEVDVSPAPGGIWACREPDAARGEKRKADIADEREKRKDGRDWKWGIQREFRRHVRQQAKGKRRRLGANDDDDDDDDDDPPPSAIEGGTGEWEDDLRVVVDYDVQILHHALRDRLEWDVASPLTPEVFAAQTCKDIGLSGEALPLIATAVRENILNHKRAIVNQDLLGLGEMWGRAEADEAEALAEIAAGAGGKGSATAQPQADSPQTQVQLQPQVQVQVQVQEGAAARDSDADAPAPAPAPAPRMDPRTKLAVAQALKRELTNRGPRPLLDAWRDWFESKEFGPLLEWLDDAEIERREVDAVRAMRRNRRDAARATRGGYGDV